MPGSRLVREPKTSRPGARQVPDRTLLAGGGGGGGGRTIWPRRRRGRAAAMNPPAERGGGRRGQRRLAAPRLTTIARNRLRRRRASTRRSPFAAENRWASSSSKERRPGMDCQTRPVHPPSSGEVGQKRLELLISRGSWLFSCSFWGVSGAPEDGCPAEAGPARDSRAPCAVEQLEAEPASLAAP